MSLENPNETLKQNPTTSPIGLLQEDEKIDCPDEIDNWDELNISPELLRGIYAYGLEKPSPIQRRSLTSLIKGRDVIAQAQSGTGKTAAFTIGALSRLNITNKTTQILCLSPTRELSTQTASVMTSIGSMIQGLSIQVLVGGNSVDQDIYNLKNDTPHIVVGCPGRVYDLMRRNQLNTSNISIVVLDEADELLSSGFKEQIYNIFQYLKTDVQVALFSATLPPYIQDITNKFMRNPVKILVKAELLTLEGISQYYVAIEDDRQKYLTLKDLYGFMSMSQCIIYANSVKRVSDLYDAMVEDGFPVCRIHSNMEKSERDIAFQEFRTGKHRVLISSNVTARGIDIQQVSVVINFDIPKDVSTYLHRIGRSGRWGRKGVGINLITRRDISKLKEIEEFYVCQIKEMPSSFDNLMR